MSKRFRITLDFECSLGEVGFVLKQLPKKLENQFGRSDECICSAPEWADQIRNEFGSVIGNIQVKEEK